MCLLGRSHVHSDDMVHTPQFLICSIHFQTATIVLPVVQQPAKPRDVEDTVRQKHVPLRHTHTFENGESLNCQKQHNDFVEIGWYGPTELHRLVEGPPSTMLQTPTFEFHLHPISTECHQLHAYPILYGQTVCANRPFWQTKPWRQLMPSRQC